MIDQGQQPTMRLRAFQFSMPLLQAIMTTGWEIGGPQVIRCVSGVPADAHFEYVEPSADNSITIVFSHPSWADVLSVDDVPHSTIHWKQEQSRISTAIDQAISNLQILSNLNDDPYMAEIIYTTADLLSAAMKVVETSGDAAERTRG